MRIRLIAGAGVSAAAMLVVAAAGPSSAYPVSDSGYAPRSPTVCTWNCVQNKVPTKYQRLINLLDDMGTHNPNQQILQKEISLYNAQMDMISQIMEAHNDAIQAFVNNLN